MLFTSERAARRRIRFERDLDPGNLTVPDISLMGCNTISGAVEGFSAVATEAKTLNGALNVGLKETLLLVKLEEDEKSLSFDPKERECGDLGLWVLGKFEEKWGFWTPLAMLLTWAIFRLCGNDFLSLSRMYVMGSGFC